MSKPIGSHSKRLEACEFSKCFKEINKEEFNCQVRQAALVYS